MPTFIDESGDTGHTATSKPYFRLAAAWLPTMSEADSFRDAIRQLCQKLPVSSDYEFKFADTHGCPEVRYAFFEIALKHPFRFTVCAIDKTSGEWRTAPAQAQHWATATDIAVSLKRLYLEVEQPSRPLREPIWVDRNDDRSFLDVIGRAFRGLKSRLHPEVPLTGKPKFRKSHPDPVIQLVDMLCGATGASVAGDPSWFDLVRGRCVGLTRLP